MSGQGDKGPPPRKGPPPPKGASGETPRGTSASAPGSGSRTPEEEVPREFLNRYHQLLAKLNTVNERKEHYKQELLAVKEQLDAACLNETELVARLRELERQVDREVKVEVVQVDTMAEGRAGRIPHFNGNSSDLFSPALWLGNVDELSKTHKWDEPQRLSSALLCLQGPAGKWREMLEMKDSPSLATWAAFKESFLARFQPSTTAVAAVKLLSNLRCKSGEPVHDFYDHVTTSVYKASEEALQKEVRGWGEDCENQKKGFDAARDHFTIAYFVNGLPPSIRSIVEAKFSSLVTPEDFLKAAVEAEVATSESSSSGKIMELEQQIAALRLSTGSGGAGRGGGAPRFYNNPPAGRGRGGANPGGNPGSNPGSNAPGSGLSHRARVALRSNWILCHKCGQWGKHLARECRVGAQKLATLQRQDPNKPPPGPPRDPWFDAAVASLDSSTSDAKN